MPYLQSTVNNCAQGLRVLELEALPRCHASFHLLSGKRSKVFVSLKGVYDLQKVKKHKFKTYFFLFSITNKTTL